MSLSGFAASPGVAEGPARVIFSADGISELQEGEILVAPLTAPSWAPVFGKIAATVTDVGGIMSHAAIVCREYGLPAVTGTAFGTKNIKTGQRSGSTATPARSPSSTEGVPAGLAPPAASPRQSEKKERHPCSPPSRTTS